MTPADYELLSNGEESDADDQGYDSEAHEQRLVSRPSKKRRISLDEPSDSEQSHSDEAFHSQRKRLDKKKRSKPALDLLKSHQYEDSADIFPTDFAQDSPLSPPRKLKPVAKQSQSKTGVIYLSRIPPFMKPSTLKSYLTPFGPVGRIFLTPEDPQSRRARVRSGGNKRKSFVDGWVEFTHKRDAKIVAETLNTRTIGGKKGGFYHDDVWNIRYLKGFKWKDLTEQIANENAERAARMRFEIGQTSKENKRFIANVERAKMLEGVKATKQKRVLDDDHEQDQEAQDADAPLEVHNSRFKSQFRQTGVKQRPQNDGFSEQPEDVQRVLSKIF